MVRHFVVCTAISNRVHIINTARHAWAMFIGLGAIVMLTSLQSMINDNSVSVVFGHAKRRYNCNDTPQLGCNLGFLY